VLYSQVRNIKTMQAWQATAYGEGGNPADTISKLVLKEDVPIPVAKDGQVVIKVEMCAINPIDWKLFSGGLHGIVPVTFPYSPGFDISGTISAVGAGVTGLAVGDKVCVDIGLVETCKDPAPAGPCGGLAQYAAALAETVSKRGTLSAETAAGLPLAGLTAYQALFTGAAASFTGTPLGKLSSGQKLLILGGSTAVGQYAIQLAKNAGISVTVTCGDAKMSDGTPKAAYLKQLGADETINYKEADWATELKGKEFDQILDAVGSEDDWKKAPGVLKAGGDYVTIANFTTQPSPDDPVSFKIFLLKSSSSDLDVLVGMAEKGALKVPVDQIYDFKDAPAALSKSFDSTKGSGAMGKLFVRVPQ
jgi:NADPH:quinone reductase-like Zn-dependent oxidoreductase